MKYKKATVSDFICDEYFQNWIIQSDDKINDFWNNWLQANPDKRETVKQAIAPQISAINNFLLPFFEGWRRKLAAGCNF